MILRGRRARSLAWALMQNPKCGKLIVARGFAAAEAIDFVRPPHNLQN
ncbi:MAG: hypothetical protein GDA36_11830 [Rhodobacteraceae bacterium]|nr:hypothetical protein [Paracoccaceae bacterium]